MLHVVALLSMEDAAQDAKAHAPESGELCAVEGAVDKQNHAYQRKFYKEVLPQQRADGRDRERQQKAGDRLGVAGHRAVVHLPRDAAVQKRKTVAGGQRQRVAIARAFLKDAPVLILDEATASLDAESEAQIQQELDRLVEGRTALIVAHRFSSIRVATRILVFEGGRIIGDGTHAELYASCPLYRELYDRQSL